MELRLDSRANQEAIAQASAFLKERRIVVVFGDRLALVSFVLVRETQTVVQEAMEAFADGVIFKSSLGTGRGDLINALRTLADGGVYFPEQIRRIAASTPQPDLPPLVEELTPRELEVASGVARGLKNNAIATLLGLSVETVKTHVGNAMDKLGARDRTQMAVMALLYGLIDPLQ